MALVNFATKEINVKLVYYGPALSGKTTNLQVIYDQVPSEVKGQFTSIATATERTLFFDYLPLDLGTVRGFKLRLGVYTVPGQAIYGLTRKSILKSVDAIVFVADSDPDKLEANIENFQDMVENLREYGLDLDKVPLIIQYNKRDLPNAIPFEVLEESLNPEGRFPIYEAVATKGIGVKETLKHVTKLAVSRIH
ncbi:MAG TPA: ADP-ribosylation factor-like protein [Caldisericia bacterium]|nr:MAG: Mutual gliding-motility protein MglA [bacterium ADurb.Bin132]HNW31697.1 ADP-ribosylation factor-like protein [Caldisericia bacterium]HNY61028.1 ADP-ribosylation factor-like protein [Caldisericia bacterium]HOC78961.1 ADP-ribosylation factor-like protein [Caldisericia bacterium]HOG69748.1 ADP-ribosylation factor-like protein [Caldisericia bacterium]